MRVKGGVASALWMSILLFLGLFAGIVPQRASASSSVLLETVTIDQCPQGGNCGAVSATASVYQDPSTRDVQLTLGPGPNGWTEYGSGSGTTCLDWTNDDNIEYYGYPPPSGDTKIPISSYSISVITPSPPGPTPGYCNSLSERGGTDDHVQVSYYSGQSAKLDIAATWQWVPYTSSLAMVVVSNYQQSASTYVAMLPADATITGQITAADGGGVVGATVTVQSPLETYTTTTGSGGSYSLSGMLPDTYTVTASACGVSASETATLPGASVTSATTYSPQLAISTGTLTGYVHDSSSGNAISGATVADGCTGRTASTNSNGYYSFSIGAGKAITYTAYAAGYNSESQTVTVPAGGSYNMNFGLSPQSSHCNQPGCCTSGGCFQNPPP